MRKFQLNQKTHLELPMTVKAIDEATSTLDAIFSTENMDRHGEIVYQDFDTKAFFGNPVVLNSHRYGDATEVVGRVLSLETIGQAPYRKTQGRIQFAVKENPKAKIIFDLYAGGFLNAVSIGVIPTVIDDEGNLAKSTFLEVSAVAVPANAEALAKQKGIDVDSLKQKGEVQDVIDDRDAAEIKYENMKQVTSVMSAFWTAYFDEDTDPDQFTTLLSETIVLLQKIVDGGEVVVTEEPATVTMRLGKEDNIPFGRSEKPPEPEVLKDAQEIENDVTIILNESKGKTKDELLKIAIKAIREMSRISESTKVETRPVGIDRGVRGDRTRLINQAVRGLLAAKK